ncbi:MAG: PD-(D/E)XK nuclease family protein [Muribaculaceae bacterium]|nr:PD-(D/E)XK nuclease family protein [Muribaculaceae bacterium]
MIPFLQSVASELVARNGAGVEDFVIVLPHKRGVTYMQKFFLEALKDFYRGRADKSRYGDNTQLLEDELERYAHSRLPNVVSIAQHVERISKLKKAGHLQLLFTLYTTYRVLYGHGQPATAEEFEAFRRWGEIIVSDFNDVDMYDVDADSLFKNLADFNDIATEYLTEEQQKVISKYFGVEQPGMEVQRFWKHIHKEGQMQQEFLSLWEKLAPLYHAYKNKLTREGLSYPGMAIKMAAQHIEEGKFKFKAHRVIYVGFNALSTIERRLFRAVSELRAPDGKSLADFFWDAPGVALSEKSPVDAALFLRKNAKEFPCSIELFNKDCEIIPDKKIVEIACPGNVAQAKVISTLLENIIQGQGTPFIEASHVAVVLPDEGLLFPVFYSVPADIVDKANITMGYPLRHTTVASLVNLLRQLHSRERVLQSVHRYFHEDVKALLSHPLVRTYLGHDVANNIRGFMLRSRIYFASPDEMLNAFEQEELRKAASERVSRLFAPLPKSDDPAVPIGHITDLLTQIRDIMTKDEDSVTEPTSLTTSNLDRYIEVFGEFADLCHRHELKMSSKTALNMACRLLSNESIPLQGQPLTGLQIMGMLETRALDFDYLIIPSMNERVFPRRLRPRTFIPDSLRIGYGIATTKFQEDIFAYHFYRLIARARQVYLLYDATQGGLKSGDPSRYLLQLRYLNSGGVKPQQATARFDLDMEKVHGSLSVPKDMAIQEKLKAYLTPGSGKALSASSLKEYLKCPLKFYFSYIRELKVDEEPTDYMPAYTIGNVLHKSMEYIYNSLKVKGKSDIHVSSEQIRQWLNGAPVGKFANLHELVVHIMRREYTPGAPEDAPLPGDALLNITPIETQIRWCLETDLRLGSFTYIASEFDRPATYQLDPHRTVNMRIIIDRLDRVNLPGAPNKLRIVDYKTGSDNLTFGKVDDLFDPKIDRLAIFQLMLYAHIYDQQFSPAKGSGVALSIYKTSTLHNAGADTTIRGGLGPVTSHLPYEAYFCTALNAKLDELFDFNIPFSPGKDLPNFSEYGRKDCSYCSFKNLCNTL